MPTCDDSCNCYNEGSRGLEVDGIGDGDNPYNTHPASGRTIPQTVASDGSLTELADTERGMLAYIDGEQRLAVYDGPAAGGRGGWMDVGPRWRYDFGGDFTMSGGDGVYQNLPPNVTLPYGYWLVTANGYLSGYIDPPSAPVTPSSSFLYVHTTIQLVDSIGGFYDQQVITVDNFALTLAEISYAESKPFNVPFQLQSICAVPTGDTRLLGIRAKRDPSQSYAGSWNVYNVDLGAITIAGMGAFP